MDRNSTGRVVDTAVESPGAMHTDLRSLAGFGSPEELGRHIAAVARVRAAAQATRLWLAQHDGRLVPLDGPETPHGRDQLGFLALPCRGAAAAAPGDWRDRYSFCALGLSWGERSVGVLAFGYTGSAPQGSVLGADEEDLLAAWSVALDAARGHAAAAGADAAVTTRVAAGLAHTLGNLLQATTSSIEAMRGSTVSSEMRRQLDEALDPVTRSAVLIQQLAVLTGNLGEVAPTEIRSLLAGLVTALRTSMPPGVRLDLDTAADELWAVVDRGVIEATLAGMVHTAREAIGAEGSITISARVVAARRPDQPSARRIVIEITRSAAPWGDRTPLPRRAPVLVPSNDGGDTLGAGELRMAFARTAITRFHGDVFAHRGAVTIALPEARPGPRPSISQQALSIQPRRLRILLADDEPVVLRGMSRLLTIEGHQVEPARDGAEALSKLRANPETDVALVDLTMPRLAGPPLVEELRALKPMLPVIVMTGYASDEMVEALRHAGAREVLRKPVGRVALREALDRAITGAPGP